MSLIVMGEYDDLSDLIRDGSEKLRNSKSLSDEAILMYNRPMQSFPKAVVRSLEQQQQHQEQQEQQLKYHNATTSW